MTPERWQQVERLYHAVLEQEPGRRAAFLEESCQGDQELRQEVETLLAYRSRTEGFLETPAMQVAAQTLGQAHPMIGKTLGCYEILAPLGAGGMGEVYRARDNSLGREVAVKLLPPAYSDNPERLRRFEQEARAAGMLNHPNILTIYAVGNHEGCPYLVSELLEGTTLRERLGSEDLAQRKAIDYARQVASGLAAAHEKGIVHRDLKPENLFVTRDGRIKILDFGLAKLAQPAESSEAPTRTATGAVLGTAGYMAPEQVRGQPADHRADIFAFGVILYEMLCGKPAFQRDSWVESMNAILKEEPPRLSEIAPAAPPALERVVWRCLEKNPEERFQSVRDLGFALEALSDISAPAVKPRRPLPARRRLGWALALLVLLAILGAGVWMLLRDRRPSASGPRVSTGAPASKNAEANEYFEMALLAIRTQNDQRRGQQLLEKALQLDPRFAEARRWHAFTYVVAIAGGFSNDSSLLYKAEEELRQALQDDPNLASVHSALAAVYLLQGRKELMPAELEKALKANPNTPEALNWMLNYHRLNGDFGAALALGRKMLEQEPLFFPARMNVGDILRLQGDLAGAVREQEKVLEQSPNNLFGIWYLSRAYLEAGELGKARAALERGRAVDPKNYLVRLGWALLLALEGKREEAFQAMDEEVLKFSATHFQGPLEAAEFYALLGETAKALEWLERAVRNGDDRADYFQRDPLLANLRKEPRFQQIVDSIAFRRKARK
jgi:serine/threonine protein kinase